jgi:hypothetical protein
MQMVRRLFIGTHPFASLPTNRTLSLGGKFPPVPSDLFVSAWSRAVALIRLLAQALDSLDFAEKLGYGPFHLTSLTNRSASDPSTLGPITKAQ